MKYIHLKEFPNFVLESVRNNDNFTNKEYSWCPIYIVSRCGFLLKGIRLLGEKAHSVSEAVFHSGKTQTLAKTAGVLSILSKEPRSELEEDPLAKAWPH